MLVVLSALIEWRRVLIVVKPATLIRWHRKAFQLFWRWKSTPRGRPRLPPDVRQLIADMAVANRTWGEERIASELLLKLGIACHRGPSDATCAWMVRLGRGPIRRPGAPLYEITRDRCSRATSSWRSRRRFTCFISSLCWTSALDGSAIGIHRTSDGGLDGPAVPHDCRGGRAASICHSRPRQHLLRRRRSHPRRLRFSRHPSGRPSERVFRTADWHRPARVPRLHDPAERAVPAVRAPAMGRTPQSGASSREPGSRHSRSGRQSARAAFVVRPSDSRRPSRGCRTERRWSSPRVSSCAVGRMSAF
jgi:hypothetical protein